MVVVPPQFGPGQMVVVVETVMVVELAVGQTEKNEVTVGLVVALIEVVVLIGVVVV